MTQATPIVCLSHLRWNFVYQRPQHIMSRLAKARPVAFIEEPEIAERPAALFRERVDDGVTVVVPLVDADATHEERLRRQGRALNAILGRRDFAGAHLWYYTPMALEFSDHVNAVRIYDCMDELSLFKGAPPSLLANERRLLSMTDVVFCGGKSLYHAKRHRHANVHCFPSAVDADHFAPAGRPEPADLAPLRRPRLGFYGVIDERLDREYVAQLAALLPEWDLCLVGPVVKIDERELPRAHNIHYLGSKTYDELPAYLEHWDLAFLPFALNDATRFISPTKTLEYLAAGKHVVATPIADVVDPYGTEGLAVIAPAAEDAARAARAFLQRPSSPERQARVERLVAESSWDRTVEAMQSLLVSDAGKKMVVG